LPTETTYEIPTWNQIYEMLLNQTEKIQKSNYKPDTIIAISRGGLIPARILSDLLETPQLATIKIEFYTGINETAKQPVLTQNLTTPVNDKKTLIVDDISDTGQTLKLAKEYIQTQGAKEAKTATIYTKPTSTTTPDYSETQTSCWIVFPWDTKETIRKIIQKQNSKRAINKEITKLIKAGLPKKIAQKVLSEMQQEQNHAETS
jgi:hypoxanthine phosphoribosyltransferase